MNDRRFPWPVLAASVVIVVADAGYAQCAEPCPNGTLVNNDYQKQPGGVYRVVHNRRVVGGQVDYNFSVEDSSSVRHVIPMADPTIMSLTIDGERWFFVTGTSEAAQTANFAIYKSRDLCNWEPHGLAFSESEGERKRFLSNDVPSGATCPFNENNATCYEPFAVSSELMLNGPFSLLPSAGCQAISINGRLFRSLWAPQLYVDPEECAYVYLTFTAVEVFESVICGSGGDCERKCYPPATTVFAARTPVEDFVSGEHFGSDSGQPWRYGYLSGGSQYIDGGSTATMPIPCSADLTKMDPCDPGSPASFFKLRHSNWDTPYEPTMEWIDANVALQGRTIMALDTFAYFDPLNENKRWMFYTWRSSKNISPGWSGNHVAAYQMWDNLNMGTSGAATIVPIAYRHNHTNAVGLRAECASQPPAWCCSSPNIPGFLSNGTSRNDARPINGCDLNGTAYLFGAAEGPAAFHRNGQNYVLFSRNSYDSPAYGLFYRHANKTIKNLGMGSDADHLINEKPLVYSVARNDPYGRSFGHGEVFMGPQAFSTGGGRYFVIFHGKEDFDKNGDGLKDASDPNIGYTGRTVYFKDLRFAGDGTITTIVNNATRSVTDLDTFIVPSGTSYFPAPVCAESQMWTGGVSLSSAAFLKVWFAGEALADLNEDGVVDAADLYQFLDGLFSPSGG